MASQIQQRLLDLAGDIATAPPDDLAFSHSVFCQTSLPSANPPMTCSYGSTGKGARRSESKLELPSTRKRVIGNS